MADDVGDLAILKIDGDCPYRFGLAQPASTNLLNQEVWALGFQAMPADLTPPSVTEATIATTRGTISRTFKDAVGTEWIEHTAAIKPGSSGGPLLAGSVAVGINSGGEPGIYRAISIAPYATKIEKSLREWREKKRSK